jgi:electron transfer flavoprotein beta subunit
VVSVVEKINEPRYPSFKGIMAAKKKPVQQLALADLGLTAAEAGIAASVTEVTGFRKRPPRQPGTITADEGQGGIGAADFLAARKFI